MDIVVGDERKKYQPRNTVWYFMLKAYLVALLLLLLLFVVIEQNNERDTVLEYKI